MDENETKHQTSDISRRKLLLDVAGGVLVGAAVGSLIPKELTPLTEAEKDQQFFGAFTDIEDANSAKWEYYEQKTRSMIEETIEGRMPPSVLQFLAVATFSDGASLAVSRINDSTEIVKRSFTKNEDGTSTWSDQTVSFEEVLESLSSKDIHFMKVEFISQPYPVNYEDKPLSTLLDEVHVTPQSHLVQKSHNVQFERDLSKDTVLHRDMRTNYILVGEPAELGLNLFTREIPNGFRSEVAQSVCGFGERDGGWNTLSSKTQTASLNTFEEEFQGFVRRS